jgi:glycogen operon protein
VYVAINSYWDALDFEIPAPSAGRQWRMAVNTGAPSPEDAHLHGQEPLLENQGRCLIGGRSIVILVGR